MLAMGLIRVLFQPPELRATLGAVAIFGAICVIVFGSQMIAPEAVAKAGRALRVITVIAAYFLPREAAPQPQRDHGAQRHGRLDCRGLGNRAYLGGGVGRADPDADARAAPLPALRRADPAGGQGVPLLRQRAARRLGQRRGGHRHAAPGRLT